MQKRATRSDKGVTKTYKPAPVAGQTWVRVDRRNCAEPVEVVIAKVFNYGNGAVEVEPVKYQRGQKMSTLIRKDIFIAKYKFVK